MKKNKKKISKKAIIICIVVLLIILGSVGGYVVYKNYNENKTTGSSWGDLYYQYLKDIKDKKGTDGLENRKDMEIGFVESNVSENPIMVMTDKETQVIKDEEKDMYYVNLYKIENEKVVFAGGIGFESKPKVELLYDVTNKEYRYFVSHEDSDFKNYKVIDYIIKEYSQHTKIYKNKNLSSEEKEQKITEIDKELTADKTNIYYTITNQSDTVSQKTLDGKELTYNKSDELIVKTGIELNTFDFNLNDENNDIRDNIEKEADDYKEIEEVTTDKITNKVDTKLKELENTKVKIEEAKAEIKADNEKKAEKEGLKVGSVTLKYGTYVSDVSNQDDKCYGTLTLKPDNKFHIKANCEGSYPYKTLDNDGTYKVTKVLNSFTYHDGIKFTTDNGVTFEFEVSESNTDHDLSDQWHGYKYAG